MWCPQCQADVAAVLMPDHRHSRCTHCGTTLAALLAAVPIASKGLASTASAKIVRGDAAPVDAAGPAPRDARDLLARWATSNAFESLERPLLPDLAAGPFRSTRSDLPAVEHKEQRPRAEELPETLPPHAAQTLPVRPAAERRVDLSHGEGAPPKPKHRPKKRRATNEAHRRFDKEQSPLAGRRPHFDLRRLRERELEEERLSRDYESQRQPRSLVAEPLVPPPVVAVEKPFNWGIVAGQVCSYLGVALLTCGTSLVLWSHFGGPVEHAPTGWLMTTAGQMLLFLGVVTLVSSGMEQTTDEVATRISTLGEKILRLEMAQREMNIQPPYYARTRRRESAPARRSSRSRLREDEGR